MLVVVGAVVDVDDVVEVLDVVVELDVLDVDAVVELVELVDDDVVRGRLDDVVVVRTTAVLSSVALPIATPMPAPASNKTNAMPHTPAGLMLSSLSAANIVGRHSCRCHRHEGAQFALDVGTAGLVENFRGSGCGGGVEPGA